MILELSLRELVEIGHDLNRGSFQLKVTDPMRISRCECELMETPVNMRTLEFACPSRKSDRETNY